jgi:hypothetical protein
MTQKTLTGLPVDVLIHITHYLDQRSQLELGIVSKFIAHISIKQLWHTPTCSSLMALKSFMHTYNNTQTNAYPYHTWLVGLTISFPLAQHIDDYKILDLDCSISITIRTLRLNNLQASIDICNPFLGLFVQHRLQEIDISNCCTDMTFSLAAQLTKKKSNIHRISIQDCYMTDSLVEEITSGTPKLRYFSSQRSGYMSDTGILAIVRNCPLIETLIVTLPKYIIQSNTITAASLEALGGCKHLKKLVCRGQIRIASEESKKRLVQHCPLLEHCDLSF